MSTPDPFAAILEADDPAAAAAHLRTHPEDGPALLDAARGRGADAVAHEVALLMAGAGALDTPRIEVRLQGHRVFLGRDHAYLMVIVDEHPAFEDDPRFAHTLPDGRRYATIGAGPRNMNPFFSELVSKVNRAWDRNPLLEDTFDVEIQHPDVEAGERTERAVVEALFAMDAAYSDELAYDIVPFRWSDGFNSNSYIASLLHHAAWEVEAPDKVPGWDKRLPESAFSIKKVEDE